MFQPEKVHAGKNGNGSQKLLCLEGLIGAGKSTLLDKLKKNVDFYFVPEPVLKWQKQINSESLLGNLYNSFDRWSYTFQINSVLTRALAIDEGKNFSKGRPLVMERSLLSDRECFARHMFDSGKMSALEWYWYSKYYDFINMRTQHPDAYIYLKTDPDVALGRINKRKRKEEGGMDVEYLKDLNRHYEALFGSGMVKNITGNTPVLVIDGNPDMDKEGDAWDTMVCQILDFLRKNGFDVKNFEKTCAAKLAVD